MTFVLVIILMLVMAVFAQNEKKMAFGLGPEWNMDSRENFAAGMALNIDYNLPGSFAAGLIFTASNNFDGITVIEPAALFRWYFSGRGHAGFFVQAELGAFIVFEDEYTIPVFQGGLRGGLRMPLGSSFYVEPYGRIGYPFAFGLGVLAGVRF